MKKLFMVDNTNAKKEKKNKKAKIESFISIFLKSSNQLNSGMIQVIDKDS